MPTSNLYLAGDILSLVETAGAKSVLDVGPGHGKYGVLLREYAHVERVDAVEAWAPYIEAFGLDGIYGQVYAADVCDLATEVLAQYDLVLLVDVIEHIHKDPALALLERIPGWVVVCTPMEFFPQPHEVPTEHHVSHWTMDDIERNPRLEHRRFQQGGLLFRLSPKGDRWLT